MPDAPGASHPTLPVRKLFVLSALSIFAAGLHFSLRAGVIGAIETELLTAIDAARAAELSGRLLGTAFGGFAFTLLFGSILLDAVGMGRTLVLCATCLAGGTALSIAAPAIAEGDAVYTWLRAGFLLAGLGWGFMEAAVNPLTAALYPDDKTNRLNIVHAWWPAGIMTGGLVVLGLDALGIGWRGQLSVAIAPAALALVLCLGTPFPRTERAASGVGFGEMFDELRRRPMFLVWWACMFLTAAAELAPNQWIDLTLTRTLGMRGIWLVVYVSTMMFALRHFAGPIAHRVSPIGMLWGSVTIATLGLLLLSVADSPVTGIGAATIWGLGVCFLWPTMLANVAERYPRGGELFIGLLGFAGAMSIQFVLPALGRVFDEAKHAAAGGPQAFGALAGAPLEDALRSASATSFQTLAWLPAILIFVFGAIALHDRSRRTA